MSFAVAGKYVVRPHPFALARGPNAGVRDRSCVRSAIPIVRRIDNSPNISRIVKRDSDQEIFTVVAQRQATRHATRSTCATRQIAEQHRSFQGQCLRGLESATLRAHHQGDTGGGETMPVIHAGHHQRDFHTQPRATARRLGCVYFHSRPLLHNGSPLSYLSLTEMRRATGIRNSKAG